MGMVCICGSMSFIDEIEKLAEALRRKGHDAITPVREEAGRDWDRLSDVEAIRLKAGYIEGHTRAIGRADCVLIANFAKRGVEGYVGPNTLVEAATGYALGKPVVFLFKPSAQACRLEALALADRILEGDIETF